MTCSSSRQRRCRSPTSTVTRFSTAPTCRAATARGHPASAARRVRTARTPAGSSGCTSSTRWSWCGSRGPRTSSAEHARLTGHAEAVLQRLELPYRVLELAAGDTGFASARTYDLEVWAAGVGTWLEASSSSTFTDFQARRANIRYRPEPKAKPEFVHTLNASGVAFPARSSPSWRTTKRPTGRCGCRRHWCRISASTAWRRVRSERLQRLAPTVAVVLVALLAGLSLGSGAPGPPPLQGRRQRDQPALLRRLRRAQRSAAGRGGGGVASARRAGPGARPAAGGDRPLRPGDRRRQSPVRGTASTIPGSRRTPPGSTAGTRRSWTRRSAPSTTGRCRRSGISRRWPSCRGSRSP